MLGGALLLNGNFPISPGKSKPGQSPANSNFFPARPHAFDCQGSHVVLKNQPCWGKEHGTSTMRGIQHGASNTSTNKAETQMTNKPHADKENLEGVISMTCGLVGLPILWLMIHPWWLVVHLRSENLEVDHHSQHEVNITDTTTSTNMLVAQISATEVDR